MAARTGRWVATATVLAAMGMRLPLAAQAPPSLVDYNRQVHAILAAKCLACHSQEKRSGGLSLATHEDVVNGGRSGAALRPGNSAGSLMIQRLTGAIEPRMPVAQPPLDSAELGIIRAWIDQGARATPASQPAKPKWEPPLALERPKSPDSAWKDWTTPLDRFTAAHLANHGIRQPQLVSDAVFARRAYLDVWGLLPSPEELRAFLDDRSPDKRKQLVARLLADTRKYAEHWISYWNDLLRNEEGVNYYSETATRRSITDWLLAALEKNTPYNEWISKLLNPVAPDDPGGFLIGVNWRGTVSASQAPAMQAAQNTAQIFLGINLKCNSCHDSFINRWKLKDAYALASYFSEEEKLQLYRCDVAQNQFSTASYLFPELNRPPASMKAADRRAVAVAIFNDPRNGRVPRTLVNRIWQRLLGRGIVENVDEMDGEPWSPEVLDQVASDFVDSGYDIKALIAGIMNSRTYQLPSVPQAGEPPKEYVFRGPAARRLTAEQFADAIAAITGEWRVRTLPQGGGRAPGGPVVISGAPVDGANLLAGRVGAGAQPAVRSSAPAVQSPPPPPIPAPSYVRAWRIPGSSLDRALGRPIRDQVYTTRDTQSTTIQALELVNGETVNRWLWRGARRMLGELPAEPVSLFSRQTGPPREGAGPVPFEVDISKAQKLYLIIEDSLSTAPDKAAPLWVQPELVGPAGAIPLSQFEPMDKAGLREDRSPLTVAGGTGANPSAIRVKLASVLVYDIAGKGFTTFRSAPGFEAVALSQGESVNARFFVFDRQPSMDRLVPPKPEMPLPQGAVLKTVTEAVDRVYWHALGRAPSAGERRVAEAALRDAARPGLPSADGLADLLWAVIMTPEFQLIR